MANLIRKIGPEIRANSIITRDQIYPVIVGIAGGNLVISWISNAANPLDYAVFSQLITPEGLKLGEEIFVYERSDNARISASGSSSGYIVSWQWSKPGYYPCIYAQKFDHLGAKVSNLIDCTVSSVNTAIATLTGGGFIETMESINADSDILGQLFDSRGNPISSHFTINSNIQNSQIEPAVAKLNYGGFVAVWSDLDQNAIIGQRYSENATKIGGESIISTLTYCETPTIATFPNGNYLVVWANTWSQTLGIYGQAYYSNGSKFGNEFIINSHHSSLKSKPSVSTLYNGGFVVVWQSLLQDGNGFGIFGQVFNNSFEFYDSEFQVNTYTQGDQKNPSVSSTSSKGFTVAWQSYGQDNSGWEIYSQSFQIDFPSPTPSITSSPSTTPSITPSQSHTPSITPSSSITPSITPTISTTPSVTPSLSKTPSTTPTPLTTTSPSSIPNPFYSPLPIVKSTPSSAPEGDMCLNLRKITLSSPGDIDRTNEELEIIIYLDNGGMIWSSDCGLFLFNTISGPLENNLNIKVPCIGGNYVGLRLIERDVCNDDIVYLTINCDEVKNERTTITIPADDTKISISKCLEHTDESQVCINVDNKVIGGGFCNTYTWNQNECNGIERSETTSSYILLHDIEAVPCTFDSSQLSGNAICKSGDYISGPICDYDGHEVGNSAMGFSNLGLPIFSGILLGLIELLATS